MPIRNRAFAYNQLKNSDLIIMEQPRVGLVTSDLVGKRRPPTRIHHLTLAKTVVCSYLAAIGRHFRSAAGPQPDEPINLFRKGLDRDRRRYRKKAPSRPNDAHNTNKISNL